MNYTQFNCVTRQQTVPKEVKETILASDRGNGLQLTGNFAKRNGQIFLDLTFSNHTSAVMSEFAIQFNKNRFILSIFAI
jgi:AP-1 complex subunit beta-1